MRGGRNAQLLDVVAQGGFDHAAGQSQGPLDWDRGSSGDGGLMFWKAWFSSYSSRMSI